MENRKKSCAKSDDEVTPSKNRESNRSPFIIKSSSPLMCRICHDKDREVTGCVVRNHLTNVNKGKCDICGKKGALFRCFSYGQYIRRNIYINRKLVRKGLHK